MKNLRLLSVATLLVCLLPWSIFPGTKLWAQSVQQGLVFEYNGSDAKTPLPNVVIAAQNAGTAQSAADGSFTLQFRTLHAGDNIQIRRAELAGYEIMNKEVVSNFRVSRQQTDQPIQIVMCTQKRLAEIRNGYRKVASQRYEKQLLASQEEIEKMRANNQLSTEIYNQRMDSLEAEYEEKLQNLENYIDKFARIDVSELDAVEKNIIDLVQAGNFDEAVAIYDQQDFPAKLAQSQADRQKLTDAKQKIAEAARQKEMENDRLRASIERQVTLLLMAGGEENQRKVLKIRHEVFLADETDANARREYASVLQNIGGDIQKSIEILLEGVAKSKNDFEKGQMLIETAWHCNLLGNDEAVISYAMQADSLLWTLREREHKVLTRSLPALTFLYLQNLPFVDREAELPGFVQRLRDNWTPDYGDPKSLGSYAGVVALLTDYDSNRENHEQALWDAHEAIRLDSCLTSICPYRSLRFQVYSNAASTFAFEGKMEELIDASNQSVECICQIYPKVKSTDLTCDFVIAAYNVMENLLGAECYEMADSVARKIDAIGLMERVRTKFPGMIDTQIGLYKIYCSQVLVTKGSVAEAKPLLEEGLQLLSADEENAMTLVYLKASSYARIEAAQGHYDKAESLYKEAIEVLMPKDKESLSAWDADNICHYYLGIADMYLAQGNAKQAKKNVKQAEKYARFELDKILIGKRKQ